MSSGGTNNSDARSVYKTNKRGHTEEAKCLDLFDIRRFDINQTSENNFQSTIASSYSKDIHTTSCLETGEGSYYTSSIEEGYANVEEVSENILQTNVSDENEEEEIFIATPLESHFVLPQTTNYTKSKSITSLSSPDFSLTLSQSESDSDSEISYKLYSGSSSDDDYSFPSPFDVKPLEDGGNLPNFTKLDPVDKEKNLFKLPLNPLVSKRTPTATATYSSESSVDEPSHILDSKSDSSVRDTEDIIKKKQNSLVKADGRKTATFCSTNIQSALLSKITPENKTSQGSPFNDFPKMQIQRRTEHAHAHSPSMKLPSSRHERDIEVDLENFEAELGKAFEESVNEGSFMPLLKQELQCKIQVRRLSMGQSELVLEPEEPKVYELTEEEIKKRRDRLEQNRRSAKKSRHKARRHEQKLLKVIKTEMTKHASLTNEVTKLKTIRDEYKKIIGLHMMMCTASMSGKR